MKYLFDGGCDGDAGGIQAQGGTGGWFVGVVQSGKTLDLAAAGARVEAFHIAALAFGEGSGDMDFEEAPALPAGEGAGIGVGGYEGSHHDDAVAFEQAGHVTDPAYMLIAILVREPGLWKDGAHHIAVKVFDRQPALLEGAHHAGGDGGLARPGQTGEPEDRACGRCVCLFGGSCHGEVP